MFRKLNIEHMALVIKHNESSFGVGDSIRVYQKIKEGEKERVQVFEGMVIKIRGRGLSRSFTVRRIGAAKVGIERIFPIESPVIEKIEVVREGTKGVKRSKLYYTREKSVKDVEEIYARAKRHTESKKQNMKTSKKTPVSKKVSKKKVTTTAKTTSKKTTK